MENIKADSGLVCTAILGYGTVVEIHDGKSQTGLRFSMYSNIRISDCGRNT